MVLNLMLFVRTTENNYHNNIYIGSLLVWGKMGVCCDIYVARDYQGVVIVIYS